MVVKGKVAAADPIKVCQRIQKKSGRKVELISPLPKQDDNKKEDDKKEEPKSAAQEKKQEVCILSFRLHQILVYIIFSLKSIRCFY